MEHGFLPQPEHRPFGYFHMMPPESASRQLDAAVQASEMPYGYVTPPPPADTGMHDERREESNKQYHIKRKY